MRNVLKIVCAFISTVVLTLMSSYFKEDGIVGTMNNLHQKERRGSEKKVFILVDIESMNVSYLQDFQFVKCCISRGKSVKTT